MACIQFWEILLVSIGELTVELHVGVSVIYNIRSSVLSYQFYIITYTLDKIHIDLHATMAVPFISTVSIFHASTFGKLPMRW